MKQTYATFNELAKLHAGETDLCKLAKHYQSSHDPILFSYVFCKLYNLTLSHANKFFNLTDADIASFSVEELNKAMLAFDESKGAQIHTLYMRYFDRRLYAETQMLNHDVRKGNYNTHSFDRVPGEQKDHYEFKYDQTQIMAEGKEDDSYNLINLNESLKSFNLTHNELSYCQLVTKYTKIKDTDIASILGISSAAITYIRRSLSKKLGPTICF